MYLILKAKKVKKLKIVKVQTKRFRLSAIIRVDDELGQRTVARLIIRLCIKTGKQTDLPS